MNQFGIGRIIIKQFPLGRTRPRTNRCSIKPRRKPDQPQPRGIQHNAIRRLRSLTCISTHGHAISTLRPRPRQISQGHRANTLRLQARRPAHGNGISPLAQRPCIITNGHRQRSLIGLSRIGPHGHTIRPLVAISRAKSSRNRIAERRRPTTAAQSRDGIINTINHNVSAHKEVAADADAPRHHKRPRARTDRPRRFRHIHRRHPITNVGTGDKLGSRSIIIRQPVKNVRRPRP